MIDLTFPAVIGNSTQSHWRRRTTPRMSRPTSVPSTAAELQSADGAFALLSDTTRIETSRSIWEATDPLDPGAVPFSEIRDRLDVRDPGLLNYHLNKLTEHFVRRTPDGYELRETGRRIFRVVLSGTAVTEPSIGPVEIDAEYVCSVRRRPYSATRTGGGIWSVRSVTSSASIAIPTASSVGTNSRPLPW